MSPRLSLIHRSVLDFDTVSSMERALALGDCTSSSKDVHVADWKLSKYDEMTTQDNANDSYAEAKRLQVLVSYENILDLSENPELEELAQEAKNLLQVDQATIGVMDLGRFCLKAQVGNNNNSDSDSADHYRSTPKEMARSKSICAHALHRRTECGLLVVPDIAADDRFHLCRTNGMRFYAGAPIRSPEGAVLGVLAVWGQQPRPQGLTRQEEASLEQLADCVMAHFLMG
ncbi:Histidine kinase [Seminavis robusta]|uniref:Histidine kinase n=1 Tax=Seminavis robusta TaxID=568900 RepID=A0A9N8EIC7_9STRA|nr:Histidine kinase [Seminavis robusta]|eukprot:Sro1127_g244160.1 Histidine kinase (230) ;mRNA; r:7957-8646